MSNVLRPNYNRFTLRNQLLETQEALKESNDNLLHTNANLADLETSYVIAKNKIKEITDNNLFKGLYAAFRLWRGERRG